MTTDQLPTTQQPDDYDSPWKEAIEHYFPEFMAFYFPNAYTAIDWSTPYHFLDQELRTIVPQSAQGKRVVDKLVKVQLLDGKERWLYIHIEVQGRREANFPRRVFICNYRIFDQYGVPVASFVILTDTHYNWRPTSYSYEFAGCKHTLEFPIVKLLDYEPRMEELLASDNAFGLITAAHLLTQKTKNQSKPRYEAKKLLMQLLLQRQWDQERIEELLRVIDWFLRLPKALRKKLKTEIHNMEEAQKMKYITSFERDAMEEGIEKGKELGVLEGIEMGKAEGLEEGLMKGRLEVAQRLVAGGMSKAEAASFAGVSVDLL
uniref:Transposase (putative) YhgA-like domain-containing protein n=1 Tax=Chlorobium chlorochromatii (strain CaD3) TaxID=340177 RepID=Q3ASJ5_CHLCH